jgi:hypothetical protein
MVETPSQLCNILIIKLIHWVAFTIIIRFSSHYLWVNTCAKMYVLIIVLLILFALERRRDNEGKETRVKSKNSSAGIDQQPDSVRPQLASPPVYSIPAVSLSPGGGRYSSNHYDGPANGGTLGSLANTQGYADIGAMGIRSGGVSPAISMDRSFDSRYSTGGTMDGRGARPGVDNYTGTGPAGRYGSNHSATGTPISNRNNVNGERPGSRSQLPVNLSMQDNQSMRSGRSISSDTAV